MRKALYEKGIVSKIKGEILLIGNKEYTLLKAKKLLETLSEESESSPESDVSVVSQKTEPISRKRARKGTEMTTTNEKIVKNQSDIKKFFSAREGAGGTPQ